VPHETDFETGYHPLYVSWFGCNLAVIAGYIGTRGDYPVARLATDDPSLPSETVAGVPLHLKVIDGPDHAQKIIVLHSGPGGDFRSLHAPSPIEFTVCRKQCEYAADVPTTAFVIFLSNGSSIKEHCFQALPRLLWWT
jgi:hypothetical protein